VACGDEGGRVFLSDGSRENNASESGAPSTCEAFRSSQVGRVARAGGRRWASPSSS
jgi:hypothetical protein